MSAVAKRPGFDNSSGNRNRRVNRYAGNLNRTDIRHKFTRGITIAFVSPDQITDTGNDLAKFVPGEFIDLQLSPEDGALEVDTAVAGQIDTIEQTIDAQAAGADYKIRSLNNQRDGKFT
jgi:hypothetical protein